MSIPLDQQLRDMICCLVDDQNAVKIDSKITDNSAYFEVEVDPSDVGKLLGRHGAHAMGIRALWKAAYGKTGRFFTLNIVDPRRRPSRID